MTIESGFMYTVGGFISVIVLSYILIRRKVKKNELAIIALIIVNIIYMLANNLFPIDIINRDDPSAIYYRTTYKHNSFVPFSGWIETVTHVRENGPYCTDPGYSPNTPTVPYLNLRYLVKSSIINVVCLAGITGSLFAISRRKNKTHILAAVSIAVVLFIDLPYVYVYYRVVPYKYFDSSIIIFQFLGMGLGYGVYKIYEYYKNLRQRRSAQQLQEE